MDRNEDDEMVLQEEFDIEVMDEAFPEVRTLPGPIVIPFSAQPRPFTSQPVAEDIQTTVTSWKEQERLQNRINDLLNENADLKAERDAKKMAIEGLTIARERLHRERASTNEELQRLREQINKMGGSKPESKGSQEIMPQAGSSQSHPTAASSSASAPKSYSGVIISLDETLMDQVSQDHLDSLVNTIHQQAVRFGILAEDGESREMLGGPQALYMKMNTRNLHTFLQVISQAKAGMQESSTSVTQSSQTDMPRVVGSSPSADIAHALHSPTDHSIVESHSYSTPDLVSSTLIETRGLSQEHGFSHSIESHCRTSANLTIPQSPQLVSSGEYVSASGSPPLQHRPLEIEIEEPVVQTEAEVIEEHSLNNLQASPGDDSQLEEQDSAVLDPEDYDDSDVESEHNVNDAVTVESAQHTDEQNQPPELQPTFSPLSPWYFSPSDSSDDALLQNTSRSSIPPIADLGSDTSMEQSTGNIIVQNLRAVSRHIHEVMGTHPLDIPTYSPIAHIIHSHHLPPLSSDLPLSTSDPALPVTSNVLENRIQEENRLEDLVVNVQEENNRLHNINRSLRHSLDLVIREWEGHRCDGQVPSVGMDLCVRMTLGFVLHVVVTSLIRRAFRL